MRRDQEFTPKAFRHLRQGAIISVQVDDVDTAYATVWKRCFCMAHGLCDESFGVRYFMVADPSGLLVNMFMLS